MTRYTIADFRTAIEGAPRDGGPSNPDLAGWTDMHVTICNDCAGRISARGCGYMLRDMDPIWDSPVTCALADHHRKAP